MKLFSQKKLIPLTLKNSNALIIGGPSYSTVLHCSIKEMEDESTKRKRSTRKRNTPTKISYENEESNSSPYFDGNSEPKSNHWQPENWKTILNNIRKMRSDEDAPVDHMGCEQCVDEKEPPEVSVPRKVTPF